jgi:GNAT superfamily N-acetyltransferase
MSTHLPAGWGEVYLEKIERAEEFWTLIDELIDDKSRFLMNRNSLLEGFVQGNLYGLAVAETDEMFAARARADPIFCRQGWYLLPCLCLREGSEAVIIWTHTRAQRRGFARRLLNLLEITVARHIVAGSEGFWERVGEMSESDSHGNVCRVGPSTRTVDQDESDEGDEVVDVDGRESKRGRG